MNYLKKKLPLVLFTIFTTLLFSLLILTANYRHYPIDGFKDAILVGGHWFASMLGIFCIVIILSINKYVFAVLFPLFTFVSSATAYFTWQFDVSINSAIFESFFYTNAGEVSGYITTPLILLLIFSLALSALLVVIRFRFRWTKHQIGTVLIIFAFSFSAFWLVNKKRYNTLLVRAPFSYYLAAKNYKAEYKEVKKERFMLGEDAYTNADSLTVVFVIGEALRADHIQLNGYHRVTMPKMEKRGVISFPKVFSPFTHTAQSLPYIFTRATQDSLAPKFEESSFIDLFKKSSFKTSWVGNQDPTETYQFFVNECDTVFINKPQFSGYGNIKKLDSDLIEPFENIVRRGYSKQLINIHIIGNHWWYNSNFPDTFAVFTPILQDKTISPSNRERMINSYDNATLFTDYVLDKMIESLEDKSALLIFLSDHGQSFGENGKWLHANSNPVEQNPACFIWLSEKYREKYPERFEALIANKDMSINSSFLFHTIIDGSLISSKYLNLKQSLFSSEFQPEKEDIDLGTE
ncbi:MAG: hypothetical protein CVT98_00470 [Bacteroidetes bacterium HGW-Bacteroidetes-15]|nr:MAG: hypothetical protein CVT98_00470 [Bacteroidetes bacterium HGW-Bacteroidetes-15]